MNLNKINNALGLWSIQTELERYMDGHRDQEQYCAEVFTHTVGMGTGHI